MSNTNNVNKVAIALTATATIFGTLRLTGAWGGQEAADEERQARLKNTYETVKANNIRSSKAVMYVSDKEPKTVPINDTIDCFAQAAAAAETIEAEESGVTGTYKSKQNAQAFCKDDLGQTYAKVKCDKVQFLHLSKDSVSCDYLEL